MPQLSFDELKSNNYTNTVAAINKMSRIAYQFFSSFSTTTDRAKEENRNGASEKQTGGSLDGAGIIGGGKNGRKRRWEFYGALFRRWGIRIGGGSGFFGNLSQPWLSSCAVVVGGDGDGGRSTGEESNRSGKWA